MRNFVDGKAKAASVIICIILTASLGVATVYSQIIDEKDSIITEYESTINNLSSQIANQSSQIQALTSQNNQTQTWIDTKISSFTGQINNIQDQINSLNLHIANFENQIESYQNAISNLSQIDYSKAQIESLTANIAALNNQANDFRETLNLSRTNLQTLVFHVCEKGEKYALGHLPDAKYTYNQLLALNNNVYEVLLLPEYKGNENWTETIEWLKANFTEIPIMLPIFEGGQNSYPITKLSTDQILEAMTILEVKSVRIVEVVGWYMSQNLTFPIDYVRNILAFCRDYNLTVSWSEWKVNENAFQNIKSYIAGYEDIVTVSFSTHSGELEPAEGFVHVSGLFENWGGSVQAWYWETHNRGNYTVIPDFPPGISSPLNMPASLLVQHALLAKNMGAKIIQFEPYWYFFDNNGQANENLKLLMPMLK